MRVFELFDDDDDAINEAKQRLDPKCWTGYKKAGTKMKGGVRVNNCVPVEEENKGLYYNVNKRKKAGTSRPAGHPKAPTAQAWKDAAKTAKKESVDEARKPELNFDIDDIKRLEQIKDVATLKAQAMALIAKPSAKPMKPEKVEWFRSALDRMDSPMKIIKLMYDLLLSGEGHQVIGSRGSMNPNSYRSRFGEDTEFTGYWKGKDKRPPGKHMVGANEAVNLDRSKNAQYPNDPATQKHRLDTAKRLLSDPKTDPDSRREAAAIIARMEPKGKA